MTKFPTRRDAEGFVKDLLDAFPNSSVEISETPEGFLVLYQTFTPDENLHEV